MLDREAQEEITRVVQTRWSERCEAGEMAAYMARTERGHSLANHVQDITVQMLKTMFPGQIAFQGSGAKRKRRSMGDVWIESGGIFTPINVKAGVTEPGRPISGQPNLVSLARLTQAVFRRWIDSYYLLFIKFVATDPPTVNVTLADLLHIVKDFTHFDAGTGQLMLKARRFTNPPPPIYAAVDPDAALSHLSEVRKDGNDRLMAKRLQDYEKSRAEMADFDGSSPIDQSELDLDPAR